MKGGGGSRFIESFIIKGENCTKLINVVALKDGEDNPQHNRFKGKYLEAINKSRWTQDSNADQDTNSSASQMNDLLKRCQVGSFLESNRIPMRSDVGNWVHQNLKGIFNIQVFDMNGTECLFKFQDKKDAEHIMQGEWRKGSRLKLEWWTPKADRTLIFFLLIWCEAPARHTHTTPSVLENQCISTRAGNDGDMPCSSPGNVVPSQRELQRREEESVYPRVHTFNAKGDMGPPKKHVLRLLMWKGENDSREDRRGDQSFQNRREMVTTVQNTSIHNEEEVEVDPVPLQVDNGEQEEDLTTSATAWIQANMIKLGQQFGVDFKGCKKKLLFY
ncbi:hypothetical protein FXO38_12269 [Capsicum annuum]|nr:hypothetical protein FXO38_12269 [Capsicum annuum]KAF3674929.1 hypothetical protein FXO37_06147 [Capsicum annuum]